MAFLSNRIAVTCQLRTNDSSVPSRAVVVHGDDQRRNLYLRLCSSVDDHSCDRLGSALGLKGKYNLTLC
eukprot:6467853-Amphidinium_carterae.1